MICLTLQEALVKFFLHYENLLIYNISLLQTWLTQTLKHHTIENIMWEMYVQQDIAVIEDTINLYHYSDFPKTKKPNS